jgi:hypothetical protein
MKKNTRKSSALISLVLVPMNLLGLGFTGGCDSSDDSGSTAQQATQTEEGEVIDFDAADPEDVYNLDPVVDFGMSGPPATQPSVQPVANSSFATVPAHHSGAYTYYGSNGGGFAFVPIPYRLGFRPIYRGAYRPIYRDVPVYGATGGGGSSSSSGGYSRGGSYSSRGYRSSSSSSSYWSSGSSRSSSSSSSSHSSSSVSRGGFGSSGHAMSSGS